MHNFGAPQQVSNTQQQCCRTDVYPVKASHDAKTVHHAVICVSLLQKLA